MQLWSMYLKTYSILRQEHTDHRVFRSIQSCTCKIFYQLMKFWLQIPTDTYKHRFGVLQYPPTWWQPLVQTAVATMRVLLACKGSNCIIGMKVEFGYMHYLNTKTHVWGSFQRDWTIQSGRSSPHWTHRCSVHCYCLYSHSTFHNYCHNSYLHTELWNWAVSWHSHDHHNSRMETWTLSSG